MPRGGIRFSSQELARVLSHYDIGVIHQLRPLSAGNIRAPKMVVIAEKGKFLLKRRPKGKDDPYRVTFAHSVQLYLAKRAFPVATPVATCDQGGTFVQLNNHIYELFKFVTAVRYSGTAEATTDAGKQLANLHRHLQDFALQWRPPTVSFHDSSTVRRHLKTIGSKKLMQNNVQLQALAEQLAQLYNAASIRVNELGFDSWPRQIVHGDWHPGNMLFLHNKLVAILDFDSTKLAPVVTDLANGMLQFSIVAGRPNPADWPAYLDQAKLKQFLDGYREVFDLTGCQLKSLLDLMVETMIAEAVLPIAATGFFGTLSGEDFLRMIHRKSRWIEQNRPTLERLIYS